MMETRSKRRKIESQTSPPPQIFGRFRKKKPALVSTCTDADSAPVVFKSCESPSCPFAPPSIESVAPETVELSHTLVHKEAMSMIRKDIRFAALVQQHGEASFSHRNLFDALVRSIVYQGISAKAASVVHSRLRKSLGLSGDESVCIKPCHLLGRSVELLKAAGMGARKAACILECADLFHRESYTNSVFESMNDIEISRILTSVKGIGQWTVDMLLMFSLRRTDILPLGDLAVCRGANKFFGCKLTKTALRAKFEDFRPFRSYVCWYLWRVDSSFDLSSCILSHEDECCEN